MRNMVKRNCRNSETDFEAERPYTDWRNGGRVEPKRPNGKGYAVRWIEYGDRGHKRR